MVYEEKTVLVLASNAVKHIRDVLAPLKAEDRMRFWNQVRKGYCFFCGEKKHECECG